jgi:hypothetical protein
VLLGWWTGVALYRREVAFTGRGSKVGDQI